ncbi:MAG TPA: hypothetical protein VLK30_07955 [Candidatus Limnocylindrales bacterium]|nr:hypothetical protein [Candidatus Limnocylindrales bacterium]
MSLRTASTAGTGKLHLARDDAEASLCGIPHTALGPGRLQDDFVCLDCIDWLVRRRMVSGQQQRVTKPKA